MTPDDEMTPDEVIAAMVSPDGRRRPYRWYDALRRHGNVVPVRPGLVAVVGHAESARALREPTMRVQDKDTFDLEYPRWRRHSSLLGFTCSMLYTNPPDHARLRRLVTGAFSTGRMRALEPAINRLTDRLLDRLGELGSGGAPVDFMTEFAFRLPIAVISEMLGVPEDDQLWLHDASANVMIALEGMHNEAGLRAADEAMDAFARYFGELIDHRREHPADDLLGALVAACDDDGDRLTEGELLGNLVLLLTAGFDTTTHLIGHGLLHGLDRPDFAERLRTEPDFAPGYVEECLRFEAPVQATTRWATEDVDLLGTPIAAGTKVLVILAAGNRDPGRYPEPHRFDPERPNIQPLSFAGGIHLCVGAPLARMEARIALPLLFRRFPHIALAGTPTYRDRWLARGHDRLPVSVHGAAKRVA